MCCPSSIDSPKQWHQRLPATIAIRNSILGVVTRSIRSAWAPKTVPQKTTRSIIFQTWKPPDAAKQSWKVNIPFNYSVAPSAEFTQFEKEHRNIIGA